MNDMVIFVQNDIPKANILEYNMFKDIFDPSLNTSIVKEDSNNKLIDFFARRKIQKITNGKFNFLFYNKYELVKYLKNTCNKNQRIFVFFLNTSFTTVRYPVKLFEYLRKKYNNIYFSLFYIDPCSRGVSDYANYLSKEKVFDLVYTFDLKDAKENGFIHWNTPYSKLIDRPILVKNDIYFGGVEAERGETLKEIVLESKKHNVKIEMDILTDIQNTKLSNLDENVFIRSFDNILSYDEILIKTLGANCVFEIVRPNQAGFTLRFYEAIVYNKKLITNNPSVLSSKYYDSSYICYFKNISDINWEWVKKNEMVDYMYQGDFSPIRLINDIKNRCLNS